VTNAEKAEQFSQLLDQVPSLLTVCVSKDCSLAAHIREQYPDMITLEWERSCTVNDYGVSGTLMFGKRPEFVRVPWCAIINVREAQPRLRLIKGGSGHS
jgi:hypothetical protein